MMPAPCVWRHKALSCEPTMTRLLEPTPQQRLAASRQAILKTMRSRGDPRAGPHAQAFLDDSLDTPTFDSSRSTWRTIQHAIRVWWYNHPAQMALELGKPVLDNYAQEKPLQLLGISAATGAAFVLLKPWRLVSMTGLAIAAIKYSNVSGFVVSLLTTRPHGPTPPHKNNTP